MYQHDLHIYGEPRKTAHSLTRKILFFTLFIVSAKILEETNEK